MSINVGDKMTIIFEDLIIIARITDVRSRDDESSSKHCGDRVVSVEKVAEVSK